MILTTVLGVLTSFFIPLLTHQIVQQALTAQQVQHALHKVNAQLEIAVLM